MKRNVSVVRFKFRFNILISGKIIKEFLLQVGHSVLKNNNYLLSSLFA